MTTATDTVSTLLPLLVQLVVMVMRVAQPLLQLPLLLLLQEAETQWTRPCCWRRWLRTWTR